MDHRLGRVSAGFTAHPARHASPEGSEVLQGPGRLFGKALVEGEDPGEQARSDRAYSERIQFSGDHFAGRRARMDSEDRQAVIS